MGRQRSRHHVTLPEEAQRPGENRLRFAFAEAATDEFRGYAARIVQNSQALGAALHLQVAGENTHHMIEACFKSVGRCLRQAFQRDGTELPSTKGTL